MGSGGQDAVRVGRRDLSPRIISVELNSEVSKILTTRVQSCSTFTLFLSESNP